MPIGLCRDDLAKQIVPTGEGAFSAPEMVQLLADLRQSGAWSYGVILDLRRMTGGSDIAQLKAFRRIAEPVDGESRGPLAIIASLVVCT